MRKQDDDNNTIIFAKQYRRYIALYLVISIFLAIVFLIGFFIIALSTEEAIIIAGVVTLLCSGTFLIIFSLAFIIKYSFRLQLYREFKKHPENFKEREDL